MLWCRREGQRCGRDGTEDHRCCGIMSTLRPLAFTAVLRAGGGVGYADGDIGLWEDAAGSRRYPAAGKP